MFPNPCRPAPAARPESELRVHEKRRLVSTSFLDRLFPLGNLSPLSLEQANATASTSIVIVCAAIGFKLYRMALVEPPMGSILEEWIQLCAYSKTNPFHDFICIVEPFFEELLSNEIGKSFITAFGASGTAMSSYHVLSMYLHTKAGDHGGSLFFSSSLIIALQLAGQVFCLGIIGSIFAIFLFSLVISNVPPTRPEWVYINYLWQAFPLLFLPLALLPCSPAPTNKTSSSLSISVFTVYKYVYGPAWWAALGAGLNAYFRHGETFNPACYFMAVDVVGFVMLFLGMYAVDAVAGDAREVMGMGRLLGGFVVLGPASTMAAYFEGQQRVAVERAEAEWIKKV
ncbi:hypothetical protein B0H14DRAFT_3753934 [Mycena olivaceomarginata]|nr:hypothetical protein B0H14DRAFT_3753934 [Mycena olivaceomarginata]